MSKIRVLTLPALAAGLVLALSAIGLARQDEEKEEKKPKAAKAAAGGADLAAEVKSIFRDACFSCHGGPQSTPARVKILDHENLVVKRKKVKPGKPDESEVMEMILDTGEGRMPKSPAPPLPPEKVDVVRRWILAGAPPFPPDLPKPEKVAKKDKVLKDPAEVKGEILGVDYVHAKILEHVRRAKRQDLPYYRYFSMNHILVRGADEKEMQEQREAFVKAINHLSWRGNIVKPVSIDKPYNTIYAVDIRQLGWDQQPYAVWDWRSYKSTGVAHRMNLYDLVLLEYPYASFYEDSDVYDSLLREYMSEAYLARPILFVRTDWFCSVITQPPLYEDLMMLPYNVAELEKYLGVDKYHNRNTNVAKRAGMTVSGVSKNNRVVERHPLGNRPGYYWVSFDFKTSKGAENMFKDPIRFSESGGEFLWTLPNGLQGYYLADNTGERLEAGPTEIVTDKFAADRTVRNGLACMRCHDQGMKEIYDDIRPAVLRMSKSQLAFDRREVLDLYVDKEEMKPLYEEDKKRFADAMQMTIGKKPPTVSPLTPVSERFLDKALDLTDAAGELGLSDVRDLKAVFRQPTFSTLGLAPLGREVEKDGTRGMIRRDAWEDYYDSAVRALGLGVPILPLDGLTRLDYPAGRSDVRVNLAAKGQQEGEKFVVKKVFTAKDKMIITVDNKSDKAVYIELIGTSTTGDKRILTEVLTVAPGKTYRYPEDGKALVIRPKKGKEHITVYASYYKFAGGKLLRNRLKYGQKVSDRVYHSFYEIYKDRRGSKVTNDPYEMKMVKRTIDIETK
jgi:serine/threonine-protein kinase